MPPPIYTIANCRPAYQLNWSLSVFWNEPAENDAWLGDLAEATEGDGVRILQHRFVQPATSQFLASTRPETAPPAIAQSVKGRLQYLVRDKRAKAFRRHYGLRSVGSVSRNDVEQYVRGQLEHHPMADRSVQQRLGRFQIDQPHVDLTQPRRSGHAEYRYNLHVVFVNDARYMEIREERLAAIRDMILRASEKHEHLVSKAAIIPDHIHLAVGCRLDQSPAEVALGYMNNLAYAVGQTAIFRYGFYVGTFGEYDLGVIPPGP